MGLRVKPRVSPRVSPGMSSGVSFWVGPGLVRGLLLHHPSIILSLLHILEWQSTDRKVNYSLHT